MIKKHTGPISGITAGSGSRGKWDEFILKSKVAYSFATGRINRLSMRCHRPGGDWLEVSVDENDTYHMVQKHLWRGDKLIGFGPLSRLDRIRLAFTLLPPALTIGRTTTVKLYEDEDLLFTCRAPDTKAVTRLLRFF